MKSSPESIIKYINATRNWGPNGEKPMPKTEAYPKFIKPGEKMPDKPTLYNRISSLEGAKYFKDELMKLEAYQKDFRQELTEQLQRSTVLAVNRNDTLMLSEDERTAGDAVKRQMDFASKIATVQDSPIDGPKPLDRGRQNI